MPRTRYFKQPVKPVFQWTSDPVEPGKHGPRDQVHFTSFKINELSVSTGDFVLVRNSDSNDFTEFDTDVARVECLYYVPENKKEPHRCVVTWLCRPAFLPRGLDNSHGMEEDGVPPFDNHHEVIGEVREFGVDIDAESIYMKCTVIKGEVTKIPADFSKQHKQGIMPCYLQRFQLKSLKRNKFSIEPIKNLALKKEKLAPVSNSPKVVTPLRVNLSNLRVSKRKLSESENVTDSAKKAKVIKSGSNSKETSPELNSYVTGTVQLNDEMYDSSGEPNLREKRTRRASKPLTELKVEEIPKIKRRHKSLGNVITGERFTQVETATGSGRKLTIKCGDRSALKSKDIIDLLDDEVADIPDKVTVKAPDKKSSATPVRRSRRASVSCTTPAKESPKKSTIKRLTASEIKKRRKKDEDSDEDDDFVPVKKPGKKNNKPVSSWSESEESSSGSEEDDSPFYNKKSTTSAKKPATKTPSKTPSKKTFKPSVAPRAKPLPSNVDPITEAQRRLHVSAVPLSLPCREEEFAEIFGYVESKLREGTGGCCYISGVPGTGKTATVMEVIRYLQENKEDYPEFNFCAMNGMRLTSPEQAYVEMWQQLTGNKATAEHAMKLLNTRFTSQSPKRIPTVFLVDELDMLCNRKQSVLYNIFDWPSKPESKLIIIAIANTMDLPERVMINRVSSRLGLTRQVFQPYTHTQLQTIVASRLEGLTIFHADAIQLVARKVASLSGDARRALDICRRATEMAEMAGKDKIGLEHVTKAHQEMFSSPKILAIRCCSKYEQILLKVMVAEFHRTGVEESNLRSVFRETQTFLRTEGRESISVPGLVAMVARLSAARLMLAEHFKLGLETKLRLNVSTEEINFALKEIKDD